MSETQIKGRFQKLRERGQLKKQALKRIIVRHKDDFLTALEKNWRDTALKPITSFLYRLSINANQVTYAGFFLIALAIFLYWKDYPYSTQLIILLLAALTDALDGPTARNNKNVTVLGTWLDHIRDSALMIWGTYLIYKFKLGDPQLLIILWILEITFIWITAKDFLKHYLQGLTDEDTLITRFSLDNLQASLVGRIQFTAWVTGYGFLLLFRIWPTASLSTLGHLLLIIAVIFSALNISESYQKSLNS